MKKCRGEWENGENEPKRNGTDKIVQFCEEGFYIFAWSH